MEFFYSSKAVDFLAMQAEVDDEQLKELENISLFARELALTKEMVEAVIKEVRVYHYKNLRFVLR